MRSTNTRRAGAYLTDNVVIVRQVVSMSLRSGRRGVTQFPYIWLRTISCCRNREPVRLWLAVLWAVLTAGSREGDSCDINICSSVSVFHMNHSTSKFPVVQKETEQSPLFPFQQIRNSLFQFAHTHKHRPAFSKAYVLALEAVQALGKEHDDHEEQEEHQRGHGHHHTQHLELCDGPLAAQAFVPDVVLHITPGCKEMEKQETTKLR